MTINLQIKIFFNLYKIIQLYYKKVNKKEKNI